MLEKSYIVLLRNLKRFDPSRYGRDSIIAESTVSWHRIFSSVRIYQQIDFKRNEIELQDLAVNFDDITLFAKDNLIDIETY